LKAVLWGSFSQNYAFDYYNKRTAIAVSFVFILVINGLEITAPDDNAQDLMGAVRHVECNFR